MRIVPSGNRSFVKLQQISPPSRKNVEQEDIGGGQDATVEQFNPMEKLEGDLKQQSQPKKVPDQMVLNKAMNPSMQKKDPRENIHQNMENIQAFKEAFSVFIQKFNINMQIITRDKNKRKMLDKMFNISPMTGKGRIEVPGWWVTPTGERKAMPMLEAYRQLKEIANNHQFEIVPTDMGMGEDVYAFDVNPLSSSAEEPNAALNGLEAMYGSGGGSHGGESKAADVNNKHAFIKESRNSIVNSLIKQGFGGKNAS